MPEDQPVMFDRTRRQAEEYATNPKKVSDLLDEAQRKAEKNRDRISEALDGLQSLSRLIKAWMHGK